MEEERLPRETTGVTGGLCPTAKPLEEQGSRGQGPCLRGCSSRAPQASQNQCPSFGDISVQGVKVDHTCEP